jgi:hypothetical protein
MEIKNYVKIYDNVLPWEILSSLLIFINHNNKNFEMTKVGGADSINFNIRRAFTLPLSNLNKSLSMVHWFNLLYFYFQKHLNQYPKDNSIVQFEFNKIFDIEVLKYENTGFYSWHTDHFAEIPRTMSCILLLNNDYEGGNLCFRNPDGSGEWEVEVKPNRMIIWPSNFLYPHTVKPVTKGIRYSVVSWAL